MVDRITYNMIEPIEDVRLADWADKDAVCRNLPNCLGDEECNPECDKSQSFGDAWQWGAK